MPVRPEFEVQALLPLIVTVPVMLAVGYSDLRKLRIPNCLSYLLIGIFLASLVIAPPVDWELRLAISGSFLVLGMFAFGAGVVGAGDVKILSALLLLVPSSGIALFAYVLAGSLSVTLAALVAGRRLIPDGERVWAGMAPGNQFPMGPSIALAALLFPWAALYLG